MVKIVWPPIKDGECCEVDCADINDADPCACECCDIAGAEICVYTWAYGSTNNIGDCVTQWYKYASDVQYGIATPSGCKFTTDGTEEGGTILEFKLTDEGAYAIANAESELALAFDDMIEAGKLRDQAPDSQVLRDTYNTAVIAWDEAEANLLIVKDENLPVWVGSPGVSLDSGCDSYEGDRYDPDTGRLLGGVVNTTHTTLIPPVDTEWISMDGVVMEVGLDPEYVGTPFDRVSEGCGCNSPDPACPDREPRYNVDLNEDGVISSDEENLCQYEDGEYYDCDPQDDCSGCMDSSSSNYDPNATTDSGDCCVEDCVDGVPVDSFAHLCCCPENALPPSEEGSVADVLGDEPGQPCCNTNSTNQGLGRC
tara:strand:+ start:199 stop:1302 length:1104 start_codon:yes stop_codon:yes gene_type:complete